MADVRLIAAAALGLAACGRAGAAPEPAASGIAAPAGWQALPPLAVTAKAALGTAVAVEGVEAWGEPAMGCYAVWMAIRASGGVDALAEQVIAGFAVVGAAGSAADQLAVRDVVRPQGEAGVVSLGFERGEHRGRLRARLGDDRIAALACFANAREPVACEAACTGLLGAIK